MENGVWGNKPIGFNYYFYILGSFTMLLKNDIMGLKYQDF